MKMNVEWNEEVGDGRKIEGGVASWADKPENVELAGGERSVRAYYMVDGVYRRASPQVSMRDLILMVTCAAKHDELLTVPRGDMVAIIAALTDSLNRT